MPQKSLLECCSVSNMKAQSFCNYRWYQDYYFEIQNIGNLILALISIQNRISLHCLHGTPNMPLNIVGHIVQNRSNPMLKPWSTPNQTTLISSFSGKYHSNQNLFSQTTGSETASITFPVKSSCQRPSRSLHSWGLAAGIRLSLLPVASL